jgi:DNA gyrase inhibitor GyrI
MVRSAAIVTWFILSVVAAAGQGGAPLDLRPPSIAPAAPDLVPAPVETTPLPPVATPPGTDAPAAPPPAAAAPPPEVSSEFAQAPRSLGRTPGDLEIDEVTLIALPVVLTSVRGRTEQILDIVRGGFAELAEIMARHRLSAAGPPMAVYLQLGDTDFLAELMVPVSEAISDPPQGLRSGRSPSGRAVRVVHAGPHETMDETYDDLSTFIEDKQIAVREVVIERFMNDPRTTAGTDLLTEIYVLLR